jgi:hypothetical protein
MMAHLGSIVVGHPVTLARCKQIRFLIFPDPAIMLAIALAQDWLWSMRI